MFIDSLFCGFRTGGGEGRGGWDWLKRIKSERFESLGTVRRIGASDFYELRKFTTDS